MSDWLHTITCRMAERYTDVPLHLIDEALLWYVHGHVSVHATDPVRCSVQDPDDADPEPYAVAYDLPLTPDAVAVWACNTCRPEDRTTCVHALAGMLAVLATEPEEHAADAPEAIGAPHRMPSVSEIRQHEPCSLSLSGTTPGGYDILLCLRGYEVEHLMHQARVAVAVWDAEGYRGKYGRHQPITYQETTPLTPEAGAAVPPSVTLPPSAPAPSLPSIPQNGLVFTVERLEASFLNKKWYWAVFGPDMPRSRAKHGVRIWEEGLKTVGLDPATMDATCPPDLTGYLAHYILKDDGTPEKIIRLVPGHA